MNKVVKTFLTLLGIQSIGLKEDGTLDLTSEQAEKVQTEFGDKAQNVLNAVAETLKVEQVSAAKEKELNEKNADIALLNQRLAETQQKLEILANLPEKENVQIIEVVGRPGNRDKDFMHVLKVMGSSHEAYDTSKWHNRLSVDRKISNRRSTDDKNILDADFEKFGNALGARFAQLHESGELMQLASGDIDYSSIGTSLGSYYYIRRQDALLAYIISLPSVTTIFPLHYGVQDGEVLVSAFEGKSFSQAYQSGEISAGSWKLAPHIAKVKNVMFKYLFTDLKDLETEYVGYLNREGSSPMKWTFIEWIIARCSEIITNEKNKRRVTGVRIEPTANKAALYAYGSDGVLTTLEKYENEFRTYVFSDKQTYTKSTIVAYFDDMADKVMQMLGTGTLSGYALYFNANHIKMFLDAFREQFGTDLDYNGDRLEIKNVNGLVMRGIPNMGKERFDAFITESDNFECLELNAGEMFAFYFERKLENLWACSYGKEGTACRKPGRAYADQSTANAAEGRHTMIFKNKPYTALAADVTTADVSVNRYVRSIANTQATALTDFTNAKPGILYKFECGATTNATTIAKANKFSTLSTAYTPTAVGDYIRVIYDNATSKFYDYDRVVGGTYALNTALAAPEYVEAI